LRWTATRLTVRGALASPLIERHQRIDNRAGLIIADANGSLQQAADQDAADPGDDRG